VTLTPVQISFLGLHKFDSRIQWNEASVLIESVVSLDQRLNVSKCPHSSAGLGRYGPKHSNFEPRLRGFLSLSPPVNRRGKKARTLLFLSFCFEPPSGGDRDSRYRFHSASLKGRRVEIKSRERDYEK
jgi:hypothetical protein